MMTLECTDIRFECLKCGQHLVVEAEGAGLTADCPICETSVTVPAASSRTSGEAGDAVENQAARPGSTSATAELKTLAHPDRAAYVDPDAEILREELIDASLLNGRLERRLDVNSGEVARLQGQLKLATDEAERLTASVTHAQAELKTFQNERQQLRADLTTARQRFTAVESQLGEREGALAEARKRIEALAAEHAAAQEQAGLHLAALSVLQREREELSHHLGATGEQLATTQGDLRSREETLAQRDAELTQLRADSGAAIQTLESMVASLRGQLDQFIIDGASLRRQLDEALPLVEEGRKTRGQLTITESELLTTLEKLQTSEGTVQALQLDVATLRRESDGLRQDLAANDSGRELLAAREQTVQTEAERERWQARSAVLEADLQTLRATQQTLETAAEAVRQERDEAVQKLMDISTSKAVQDNEILRGIVARQNSELAQQHGELYRLKRARFVLKIVYSVFGLGLLAVVAFACKVIAHVKF